MITNQGHIVYSLDSNKIVDVVLPDNFDSIFSDRKWGNQNNLLITLAQMKLTDLPFGLGGWTGDRFRLSEWIGFDLDDLKYEGELDTEAIEQTVGQWAGNGRWIIVNSGNGLHVWCKISPIINRKWYSTRKEAYTKVAEDLQNKLAEIGIKVKADTQVFRPNMSFRLPGTINVKQGKYKPVFILAQNEKETPCSKLAECIEDWYEAFQIISTVQSAAPSSFLYHSYNIAEALLNAGIRHRKKNEGRTAILGYCPYCGQQHKAYITKRGNLRCLRSSCEANSYKPPSDWLQKIGVNPDLYKGTQEVATYTPQGFAKEFPDVDSFRKNFSQALPGFLDLTLSDSDTVSLVASTPGSGKSSSVRQALATWLSTTQVPQRLSNSEGQTNPVVGWIVPTHRLADEAENHFQELGIKTYKLEGRAKSRNDCLYPGQCRINDSLGKSSSQTCNYCSQGPNRQIADDHCTYYKQLFEAASPEPGSVIITTISQWYALQRIGIDIFIPAEQKHRKVLDNISMFIFDECPEDGHLPTQVIYRDKNPTEESDVKSIIYRDCWPKEATIFSEVIHEFLSPEPDINLAGNVAVWEVWCDKTRTKIVQGRTLRKIFTSLGSRKIGSRKAWNKLLKTVSQMKAGINRDENNTKVTVHSLPAWVPKVAELLLNRPENLSIKRIDGKKVKHSVATLTIFEVNRAEPERLIEVNPETGEGGIAVKVPCLILDAYGETSLEDWQRLFHKRKVELQVCRIKSDPNRVQVLWEKYNTSRSALRREEKFSEAIEGLKRQIGDSTRPATVYTHKGNLNRVKEELQQYGDQVVVDHYGSGRGINSHSGRDIILYGEARLNDLALEASLHAVKGKKPDQQSITKKSREARFRAYMEAGYRSRPLDSPEGGLKIVVFSQDRPPSELVYGVKTEKVQSYKEKDLATLLNRFKEKYGWILSYNFLTTFFEKKPKDFHFLPELFNSINQELGQFPDITTKNSREKNQKVFSQVTAGMRKVRVDSFGFMFVSQNLEQTSEEIVRTFCSSYNFKIPKWAEKALAEHEERVSGSIASEPASEEKNSSPESPNVQATKYGRVVDFPKRESSKKADSGGRANKIPRIELDRERILLANCS